MLKKILVVDDSELIHNMYRLMLKKYRKCEMLSARNGKEALSRLAADNEVELILLDTNMPVMNGHQFLETLKRERPECQAAVIIVSTEGKEDDILRGLSMGADGYIVKPFRSIALHHLIDRVIAQRTAEAAASCEERDGLGRPRRAGPGVSGGQHRVF